MKLALIGIAAVVAATFAGPALAQAANENSGYPAQLYVSANHQDLGLVDPLADGSHYRDWQSRNAMMLHQANEAAPYRYHGGPKSND
jgi:hypothetical protein